MLDKLALGSVVWVVALGCGSTEKPGGGSSASVGGNGGTGTETSGASTTSDVSNSLGSNTTSQDTSSTGAGGQSTASTTSGGDTEGSTTASSTDAAGGSSFGGNGSTTATGTDGAGGSGPISLCPAAPPSDGDECTTSSFLCAYEDCGAAGRTVAYCSGTWSVELAPCDAPVVCGGSFGFGECAADEVCLVSAGGAVSQECVQNTCGDGPLECDCLTGCFGECALSGSATMGLTMSCNTCPDASCP
jgi:hypothetical protein